MTDDEYLRRCEHMRTASAQLRDAILLALKGINPRTSDRLCGRWGRERP